MIKNKSHLEVEIAGKKFALSCDTDSSLGHLFDALMQMKGWCVDRMVAAHKEEEGMATEMKATDCSTECLPTHPSEIVE